MVPVVLVLAATRPRAFRRSALRWSTLVTGLGVFAAYGLTLVALALVDISQAPAVAALRESSILFVLGLSWLTHRSTVDGRRPGPAIAAGAGLVFTGVVVLALVH
jgi:drug/metabolite transporter (DMT)-like permease